MAEEARREQLPKPIPERAILGAALPSTTRAPEREIFQVPPKSFLRGRKGNCPARVDFWSWGCLGCNGSAQHAKISLRFTAGFHIPEDQLTHRDETVRSREPQNGLTTILTWGASCFPKAVRRVFQET